MGHKLADHSRCYGSRLNLLSVLGFPLVLTRQLLLPQASPCHPRGAKAERGGAPFLLPPHFRITTHCLHLSLSLAFSLSQGPHFPEPPNPLAFRSPHSRLDHPPQSLARATALVITLNKDDSFLQAANKATEIEHRAGRPNTRKKEGRVVGSAANSTFPLGVLWHQVGLFTRAGSAWGWAEP